MGLSLSIRGPWKAPAIQTRRKVTMPNASRSSSTYRCAGAPSSVSSSRGNTLVGLSRQLFLSETYTQQQNASAGGALGLGTTKCLCMNLHMGKANPSKLRTRCWNP